MNVIFLYFFLILLLQEKKCNLYHHANAIKTPESTIGLIALEVDEIVAFLVTG